MSWKWTSWNRVAKEIVQRSKSDPEDDWKLTPELIEEAQRIVDLTAGARHITECQRPCKFCQKKRQF